jgi:hypothetical protein
MVIAHHYNCFTIMKVEAQLEIWRKIRSGTRTMNTHTQQSIRRSLKNSLSKVGLSKAMTKLSIPMLFALGIISQTACETRAGTGAAAGAGTGALIAGPAGAAVGAGVGAVGGAAMDERHGARRR